MWSFGVLVWELASGADIADYQPLALSSQLAAVAAATAAAGTAGVSCRVGRHDLPALAAVKVIDQLKLCSLCAAECALLAALSAWQQPPAPAVAAGGGEAGEGEAARVVVMPGDAPPVAARIFAACTQLEPGLRPSAQQVVEWLRAEG